MIRIVLWALMQTAVIGLLWSAPIMFWGKVLVVALIGLLSFNKLVQ